MSTSGNHPNDSIIKIGQNTKKSPADLRRLAVTQTPVRNRQIMVVGKTLIMIISLEIANKKKRTWQIVRFAILADHRVKLKESKKRDKYVDFSREVKKFWTMKVTVIPIVIGALGTVTKGLIQGPDNLEIS